MNIPKSNCFVYVRFPDQKKYKPMTPDWCQTTNLVYAAMITPERFSCIKEIVGKVAKTEPNVKFKIVEYKTKKVYFHSDKIEK